MTSTHAFVWTPFLKNFNFESTAFFFEQICFTPVVCHFCSNAELGENRIITIHLLLIDFLPRKVKAVRISEPKLFNIGYI